MKKTLQETSLETLHNETTLETLQETSQDIPLDTKTVTESKEKQKFNIESKDFSNYFNAESKDYDFSNNFKIVEAILNDIKRINSKGFVNSLAVHQEEYFPILSTCIKNLIIEKKGVKLEKVMLSLTNKELIDLSKWSYNLIILRIYRNLMHGLVYLKESPYTDISSDYQTLSKEVYSKLDSSIRTKLQKKGITVMQNIYTGFDTEYKNIDLKYNKLLSIQMAVNTKILLKLPIVDEDYYFSSVETLTGKVNPINCASEKIKYENILDEINISIKEVRMLKYKTIDESINLLIKNLKLKNVPYIIKNESIIFAFDRTPIQQWLYIPGDKGFSLEELIKKSNELANPYLDKELLRIYDLLKTIYNEEGTMKSESVCKDEESKNNTKYIKPITEIEIEKPQVFEESLELPKSTDSTESPESLESIESTESTEESIKENVKQSKTKLSKKFTRTNMKSFTKDLISVTKVKNNYLIGHLTNADLSMLNDFEKIKNELDIVNKSYVSLTKPIIIDNVNVIIRDTMLLAPGGKKSLQHIGSLYGKEFNKIELSKRRLERMDLFLKEDFENFKEYALKDSLITLIHASYMEDFNFKLGQIGIPITLSSLGSVYLKNVWGLNNYNGYQISHEYLLGESSKTQTPKGLLTTGVIGLNLSLYIGNYKGGRNESFMYGMDKETKWYDYDLTSAYTTAMAMLGNPDYSRASLISTKDFLKLTPEELLYSYTIIKGKFDFPSSTKYPSIPCFLDETTTVYPLEGECLLTGAEYLLAKTQKCNIKIEEVFTVPFSYESIKKENGSIVKNYIKKPYFECIKELQSKRREYEKGTINNALYKEIGNSIYGLVVRGINNKMKFDIKSGKTIRMNSNDLSNPIIASWITGFIRSVIGELLHNISQLNGKVVSATTDGFITDLDDLENKILEKTGSSYTFLNEYRKIRSILSKNPISLELKNEGKGIISWSTRGQLSKEAGILACTGYQRNQYKIEELETQFIEAFNSQEKTIDFVQTSLRSALDIYKKGGHVTPVYTDRKFRLHYDNRREIIIPKGLEIDKINYTDLLLDSKPVKNVGVCEVYRFLSKLPKQSIYQKNTSINVFKNTYKSYTELAVRNFLKALLNDKLNLNKNVFKNYNEILEFIKNYDKNYKLSVNVLSQLKRRGITIKGVVRNEETENFVSYIKKTFPDFDEKSYFK